MAQEKIQITRSLDIPQLAEYISRQLNHFFPDPEPVSAEIIHDYLMRADERVLACFANVPKKYFNFQGNLHINHLHSDQYCMYLYMLSRHCYVVEKDLNTATKLYCLNKSLHGVEIYFTIELPETFLFVHPVGSVLGPATFKGFFVMYQNCLVGCLNEQIFPVFEGKAILYAGSSVLGKCTIGDNCVFAAYSHIVNTDIKSNSLIIDAYPNQRIIPNTKDFFQRPPFLYQ